MTGRLAMKKRARSSSRAIGHRGLRRVYEAVVKKAKGERPDLYITVGANFGRLSVKSRERTEWQLHESFERFLGRMVFAG
jgi:hypothetical protein